MFLQTPSLLGYANRINPNTANREYRLTSAGSKYLSLPHDTDLAFGGSDSFTLSIYVKFAASMAGVYAPLFSKRAATGAGIQLYKGLADQFYWLLSGTSQAALITGSFAMTMEQWHMITVVYNGAIPVTGVKFYLDGKDDVNTVQSNTFGAQTITNTQPILIGTRLNSPLYADMQVGGVYIHNRALGVNEIPDTLWNYGVPRPGTAVANCIRSYRLNQDTYSSGYIVVDAVAGKNGTSVNMSGTELVSMNSVSTPTPLNVQASPQSSTQNFIGWDPAGSNVTYDVDVSNDGSTGWVRVASSLDTLYYVHSGLAASTLRYYRVRANGVGTVSSNSSVVSATTLSSSYTDVFFYNTRRLGDNSYNFGLAVETQRCAPQYYYDSVSNKTYGTFMSRAEQGYDMATYCFYYDHTLGTFSEPRYVGLKSRQGLDRHPIPAIIVAADGHIIVSTTDFHNGPLQIYRSVTARNIDSFTKVAEFGDKIDYPEFRLLSTGRLVVFFRYYVGSTSAGIGYNYSDDSGVTWGTSEGIVQYTYSVGRTYPMLMPQPASSDRVHILVAVRNDSGGPNPGDPDQVGYFKDYGYMYSDDLATWRNAGNTFSKNVVTVAAVTSAEWIANCQFHDSVGTYENGLPVGLVTAAGVVYITSRTDAGTYAVYYWNGASWTTQTLTFPDVDPNKYAFGYHGIQVIKHNSGNNFDIWCTHDGVVKKYNTTDKFVTLTLVDGAVLPAIGSLKYEQGCTTHNLYECAQPFLIYSLKTVEPTPNPTSPGAWADIVMKKLW